MSVAAVMLVKDEADIIEPVLRHLAEQVDWILLSDNVSTDGTKEIVRDLALPLTWATDPEPGYYQSRKTTELAKEVLELGHQWVLPVDADEIVYVPDGRSVTEYLGGVAPDVMVVSSALYNHLPSAQDIPYDPNPVTRIGWRQKHPGPLPKIAARLRPDLVIEAGNHSARFQGTGLRTPGLVTRHFSWRTPEQYLRKIRNGQAAYAATDLPESTGAHWRMFRNATDEAVLEHFDRWFFSHRPQEDETLIYDPAPASGQDWGDVRDPSASPQYHLDVLQDT